MCKPGSGPMAIRQPANSTFSGTTSRPFQSVGIQAWVMVLRRDLIHPLAAYRPWCVLRRHPWCPGF